MLGCRVDFLLHLPPLFKKISLNYLDSSPQLLLLLIVLAFACLLKGIHNFCTVFENFFGFLESSNIEVKLINHFYLQQIHELIRVLLARTLPGTQLQHSIIVGWKINELTECLLSTVKFLNFGKIF